MATNFHADLPNDQIHPPKDFATARSSSVLTKNHENTLEWNDSPFDLSSTITCGNDVAGGLHNRSFYLYWSKSLWFEVYYAVAGDLTPFDATTGYTSVKVDINPNDTAITIASLTKTEVDRQNGSTAANFTTSLDGHGKLTISGMSDCGNSVDSTTGFLISNTSTPKSGVQYLSSTAGVLDWTTAVSSNFEQNMWGYASEPRLDEYLFANVQRSAEFNLNIGPALSALSPLVAIKAMGHHCKAGETFGGAHGVMIATAGLNIKIGFVKHSVTCTEPYEENGTDLGFASFTASGLVDCYTINANPSVAVATHDLIVCYVYASGKIENPKFEFSHKLIINK